MGRNKTIQPVTIWIISLGALALVSSAAFSQQHGHDLKNDLQDLHVRHETAHYELAGTVTDKKLTEFGQALEYIYNEYAKGFGELLNRNSREKLDESRFRVVILATASDYAQFTRAYFGGFAEHTSGMFVPAVDLLIIRDGDDANDTYATLFHEGFHQFIRRIIPHVPIWLNEGLATYYGTARATRKRLVFDRPRRDYFRAVNKAATSSALIQLSELFTCDRNAFYNRSHVDGLSLSHRSLCYAQSYTLMSYMINDRQGRKHLRNYLRALAAVKDSAEVAGVTRDTFPDPLLRAMVTPWLAHVKRGQ